MKALLQLVGAVVVLGAVAAVAFTLMLYVMPVVFVVVAVAWVWDQVLEQVAIVRHQRMLAKYRRDHPRE